MNTSLDRKVVLSSIWIFVVLNYLYCDVAGLMDANLLRGYLAGEVGGMRITETFLLLAGFLMEISIGMTLLARILPYRPNRAANMVAGTICTLVQGATVVAGGNTSYYLFFSAVEIAATVAVVVLAVRWRPAVTPTATTVSVPPVAATPAR